MEDDDFDTDYLLSTLQSYNLLTITGESTPDDTYTPHYRLTDKGEAFLHEDLSDFDRYRQSLKWNHRFSQRLQEQADNVDEPIAVTYDADRYDADALQNYLFEDNPDDWAAADQPHPRFAVFNTLIEHPKSSPSIPEAVFMTAPTAYMEESGTPEDLAESVETIFSTLEAEHNVVEQVELPELQKKEDGIPDTFYRIPDEAKLFLEEETKLLGANGDAEEFWKTLYNMVTKPPEIEQYEAVSRPS